MSRPCCRRRISIAPTVTAFGPYGPEVTDQDALVLTLDEFEAIRHCDRDQLHQHQAAEEMNVSRQTLGRIIESARRKIAIALTEGRVIKIVGGECSMSEHRVFCCNSCSHRWETPFGGGRPKECPSCHGLEFHREHPVTVVAGPMCEKPKPCCGRMGEGRVRGRGRGRCGKRGQA
jgi:predicted DNA-binding protein (UPF0251 family)